MSRLDDDELTFARMCCIANAGDKEAHIALGDLAHYIAKALARTINIVGATHVLIDGQLRSAGDGFPADLSSALCRRLIPSLAQRIAVDYAVLRAYAGTRRVAAQALDALWRTEVLSLTRCTLIISSASNQ